MVEEAAEMVMARPWGKVNMAPGPERMLIEVGGGQPTRSELVEHLNTLTLRRSAPVVYLRVKATRSRSCGRGRPEVH